MVQEITKRYKGKTTGKGHDIRIDESKNGLILWFLYWGEYEGVDAHHHMGIAYISKSQNGYSVGWLKGTEQQPYSTDEFSTIDDLFTALDDAIAKK